MLTYRYYEEDNILQDGFREVPGRGVFGVVVIKASLENNLGIELD